MTILGNLGDLLGLASPEDAEKELLKLLQILNAMPQGTPADAKKLSAKFAEPLGLCEISEGTGGRHMQLMDLMDHRCPFPTGWLINRGVCLPL